MRTRAHDLAGPALFTTVATVLTWVAALLVHTEPDDDSLLEATMQYILIVGWPPLVAFAIAHRAIGDQRELDHGIHPTIPRTSLWSIASAVALLLASAAVDAAIGDPIPTVEVDDVVWTRAVLSAAAFVGVLAMLWLQAVIEELAWRGYVLPRLMRALGRWPGLLVHGVAWGLCYAPVLIVDGDGSLARTGSFVITCTLLGCLLGWVRLAAGSIFASAASNTTLTICAGLPLVLQNKSSQLAAMFEPIGWVPMLAFLIAALSRSSWRARVAIPQRPLPEHVN